MARITDVLTEIQTLLQDSTELATLLKNPNITLSYKRNSEIKTNDMPMIMITKPKRRTEHEGSESVRKHTIVLFAGIIENDKLKAQETIHALEELIDNILESNIPEINSEDSASDDFDDNRYWLMLTYEYSEVA